MNFGRLLWVLGVVAACSVNLEPLDNAGAGGAGIGGKDASSDKPGLDVCVTCGGGGTPTGGQGGTSAGGSAGAGSGGVAGATGGGGAAGSPSGGAPTGGGGAPTGGVGNTGGTPPSCNPLANPPPPPPNGPGCDAIGSGACVCLGCFSGQCDQYSDCLCAYCNGFVDCGCNNNGVCDPYNEDCMCNDCKTFC